MAQGILTKVRRVTRRWVDRLDPDFPPPTAPPRRVSLAFTETPNPRAKRVEIALPGIERPLSWTSPDQAKGHKLASAVFVEGVAAVFVTSEFLTITVEDPSQWPSVQAVIEGSIAPFLA